MSELDDYFEMAFNEAYHSVRNNIGGPFGAVVVKDGQIIGKGGNMVISSHDPTAHAEIVAIRDACKNLGTFDLNGAVIYATCEPCPMCFAAIYWANISRVYYSQTKLDAASIGFRDNHIYEELPLKHEHRSVPFIQKERSEGTALFEEWKLKMDKTPY